MRLFSFLNYFRNVSNVKTSWSKLRTNISQSNLSMTSPPLLREESRLTDCREKYITAS